MAEKPPMNVLLDTCAVLALARGDLPERAASALAAAEEAFVSAVSPWEVAIKAAGGKLRIIENPVQWFIGLTERYRLKEVPLDSRTACTAAGLPPIHRDPFDRVLVAVAQTQELTILTSDTDIPKYSGVSTLW